LVEFGKLNIAEVRNVWVICYLGSLILRRSWVFIFISGGKIYIYKSRRKEGMICHFGGMGKLLSGGLLEFKEINVFCRRFF